MKRALLFILFLLGFSCLFAGTDPKINYPLNGIGFIVNNNPNPVIHQAIMGGSVNWATQVNTSQEFYSLSNTLELYQYESTDLPVNFEYDLIIKGKLEYYQIGSSTLISQGVELHINNKLQGGSRRIDFYSYSNAYNSKFTLESINLTGNPPSGTDLYTAVSKIVELNLSIQKTHFIQPDPSLPVSISSAPCLDPNSNELVLTWAPVAYAEEYELEVIYVDDYSTNGTPLPTSSIQYDFRENATRIVLKQLFYRLPTVYDRGYLLYRIRPVGRGGPLWDKRIPGPWSPGLVSGTVDNFLARKYIPGNEAHTTNKINWQLTTTYADDGKRKDIVQYSDGLYMTRQTVTGVSETRNIFTQTNNNNVTPACASPGLDKTKEIIAQENIYDFNGRVGVQIMPVPTGMHKIDYIPNLNQNTAGIPYSWKDFDIRNACNIPAAALNQNTTGALGAGQYYSPNNPNKIGYNAFIPDGEGFPFSRVQYTNDNSGKVSLQGGVGLDFQPGSTHETKFFYGTPTQVELDRMFGTEVGYAQRYLKKMVVDPNGQTSVTYENPEGKTIATALTGNKPANLLALDNEPQLSVEIDVDAMADNVIDSFAHSMSINKQFLVPTTGQYVFNYTVQGQMLNYINCNNINLCLDCIYDLDISLQSNDGCTAAPLFKYTGTFGDLAKGTQLPNIDKNCFNGAAGFEAKSANFPASFALTLNQGSYTLKKTLTVNKNAAEAYVNLAFADTCRTKFDEILADEMSRVDTTDCNQIVDTTPLNDCDMARQIMLADLKPGGQYAQFSVASDGKYYSVDPLSIFKPGSNLPLNPNLSAIVDLNSSNISDPLYINNLINNWNLTTAQENMLLQSHPEYGLLQWCNTQNTGKNYDLKLRTTNTYPDAVSLGIITNGGSAADTYQKMLNDDPFFSTTGSAYKTGFLDFMNNVCSPGVTIQHIALQAAYCSSGVAVQNLVNNYTGGSLASATAAMPPCVLPTSYHSFGSDPATSEMEWKMLRDLYLSYKEKYLYESRRDYSINNGYFNGCIGNQNYSYTSIPYSNSIFTGYPTFFGNNSTHDGYSNSVEGYIPINDPNPCGLNYSLYKDKVKRFTNRYDAFSITTSQTINLSGIDLYNNCIPPSTVTAMQSQVGEIVDSYFCDSTSTGTAANACGLVCNTGFEQILNGQAPATIVRTDQNNVPCWKSSNGLIAICHNGFMGIPAYSGQYFNLLVAGAPLYQTFSSTGTKSIVVSFAHRGKLTGLDHVNVSIGPDGGPYTNLGTYSDNNTTWGTHSTPPYTINAGTYRLIFTPGASTNAPGESVNFLDSVTITCRNVPPAGTSIPKADRETNLASAATASEIRRVPVLAREDYSRLNKPIIRVTDTCKTLSPFATELFSFLNDLKDPKKPKEGSYTYRKRKSILYTKFTGAETIRYDYKDCHLRFTGKSTRELNDPTCTITFDDCYWMDASVSLISIEPYFDNSNAQTNRFILTYRDAKTNRILKVKGASNCLSINECKDPVLCGDNLSELPLDTTDFNGCVEAKYLMARENALQRYTHWVDSMRLDIQQKYYAKCMQAIETLKYTYTDQQFHYTLYYYDQAGNLSRTIPPAGVRLLGTADAADVDAKRIANAGGINIPSHFFITNYKYNSLNQLVWQTTPDAGRSNFYYDKLGRIAASQNAKQQPGKNYSYTYYDLLGRTVESGELLNVSLTQTIVNNYAGWKTFLHNTSQRKDITYTQYNEPFSVAINNKFGSAGQQNLRGRVAGIFSFADNNSQNSGTYKHATHYTYDVSGNIPVVIQDYPDTPLGDKVIAYNFDLISGKVNEVRYEPGMQDEFRHKFSYDDELRLTNVYTSRKGIIWQRDAEYFYYKHGPLARTELGELKVQGLDHIYTLQGWIKGVNGAGDDMKKDAGRDGVSLTNGVPGTAMINGQMVATKVESNPNLNSSGPGYNSLHSTVAADAFRYALSYYNGDYKPIAGNQNTFDAMNTSMTGVQPLYNGNISRMYTYLQTLGGLGMNYGYDQLNRLKYQQAFTLSNTTPSPLDAYSMDLNYDGNGNIINLLRTGRAGNKDMDKLAYRYYDANNVEIPNMANPPANATNRLASVKDVASSGNYPETGSPVNGTATDIDNQNSNNYTYDAIGNLIKDAAEDILDIKWNLQNKITEIDKTGSKLFFAYDALGNRVSKKYETGTFTTEIFYVRNASGNIMGTYEFKEAKLNWQEQELYGSSRLGIWQPNQLITTTTNQTAWDVKVDWQNIQSQAFNEDSLIRGSKQYELSNHLGNVLATISDSRHQLTPAPNGSSGITADLMTATDYYPFGMQMPGRSLNSGRYKFGFNGQNKDDEIKGEGNSYAFKFRMQDPRLGRFLSCDPLMLKYPYYTPYQFGANNPVLAVDIEGLESSDDKNSTTKEAPSNKTFGKQIPMANVSTHVELKPLITVHKQPTIADRVFPTKNDDLTAALELSIFGQGIGEIEFEDKKETKVPFFIEKTEHYSGTTDMFFLGGGVETTKMTVWTKGNGILKDKNIRVQVEERIETLSIGIGAFAYKAQTRELYEDFKKVRYQYRNAVEAGHDGDVGGKDSPVKAGASITQWGDWIDIPENKW